MSGLRSFLHSTYKSAAEAVLPARSQSAFKEKGVRTWRARAGPSCAAAEPVLPPTPFSAALHHAPPRSRPQVLTPEEFVAAGDYLVHTCPTWSWEAGDAKKARPFLPPTKQFLITRNGGCLAAGLRCTWTMLLLVLARLSMQPGSGRV